jgi:hypothetical protein
LLKGLLLCEEIIRKALISIDLFMYLANPAMERGHIEASDPPATITSASPNLIILKASPIEWAPVVQAVEAA